MNLEELKQLLRSMQQEALKERETTCCTGDVIIDQEQYAYFTGYLDALGNLHDKLESGA